MIFESAEARFLFVSACFLGFLLFLEKRQTQRALWVKWRQTALLQSLFTVTLFLWAWALLVVTGGLESLVATMGAAQREIAGESAPMAMVAINGEPLSHVLPEPGGWSPAAWVARRSLIALIASGVTSAAFVVILGVARAYRAGTGVVAAFTELKTLSWRPTLLTAIGLWIATNWTLFLWQGRHLLGTDPEGYDRLLTFLHTLPEGVSVILWGLMLGLWIRLRRRE